MFKKFLIAALFLFLTLTVAYADTTPPATPSDNDRLIQAYMKTKDTSNIKLMLDTYAKADAETLKMAKRFSLFSPVIRTPNPLRPMLGKRSMTVLCDKYGGCTPPSTEMNRFFMIASGFWALTGLSKEDKGIQETLDKFLKEHQDIQAMFEDE